jgi:uncharacterized protein YprB with RNaseH-like and TPR domain
MEQREKKFPELVYRKPRIVCFDIEATNLNANFGYVLCASFKEVGKKKVITHSIADSPTFAKDVTNDKWLLQQIVNELEKYDIVITWYGRPNRGFDIPFIQTRLLSHDLPLLKPINHIDGWAIARNKLKLNSNRLDTVSKFLGVTEKTPLSGPIWIRAMAGYPDAIAYVIKHCEADVLSLEDVYHKIKPLMTNYPNINLLTGNLCACPTCGAENLVKRGKTFAGVSFTQIYMCRDCKSYSKGKATRLPGI